MLSIALNHDACYHISYMNRADFPFYQKHDLIYLDNAASSQTPRVVLDAMNDYYINYRANIHRGVYSISEQASETYDEVRRTVANFFSVKSDDIILTSGSTLASNMLIMMLERYISWQDGDTVISSYYEHHSIALPIIELAKRKSLNIKYIDHNLSIDVDSKLVYDEKKGGAITVNKIDNIIDSSVYVEKSKSKLEKLNQVMLYQYWKDIFIKNNRVRLINLTTASNINGRVFNIAQIVRTIDKVIADINIDKRIGDTNIDRQNTDRPIIITDLTAIAGHKRLPLHELGVDAAWCAGHKMCGPTGTGILYIRRAISRMMRPVIYGGGMVWKVEEDDASYRSDIEVYEAGTANVAGLIGLGAAIKYIESIGIKNIENEIETLHAYALHRLKALPYLKLYTSDSAHNIGILSFVMLKKSFDRKALTNNLDNSIHAHDIAQILSDNNIAVRAGHHCAQLYMRHIGEVSLCRVSLYFYNQKSEIDELVKALDLVYQKLG